MRSLGLERKKSVTFGVHEVLLLAACHRTWLVHASGYAKNGMWEGDGHPFAWIDQIISKSGKIMRTSI